MDIIHKEVLAQQLRRLIHSLVDECKSLEDLDLIYKILLELKEDN